MSYTDIIKTGINIVSREGQAVHVSYNSYSQYVLNTTIRKKRKYDLSHSTNNIVSIRKSYHHTENMLNVCYFPLDIFTSLFLYSPCISLTPVSFYWSACTSQASERSYMCELGVYIWPLSTYFSIGVWNCYDSVIIFVFHLIATFFRVSLIWVVTPVVKYISTHHYVQ